MSVPSARRTIEVSLNDTFSLKELEYRTLDESIAMLQGFKTTYAGRDVVVRTEGVPYDNYEVYALYERRLETDEEMAVRHAQEVQWAAQQEVRDREQFTALQARFGTQE